MTISSPDITSLLDDCISVEICVVDKPTGTHTRYHLSDEQIADLSNRATQPAAPAAKPVAWQYQLKNGQWANLPTDWQESENMPDRTYRPLYSAPSAMAQSDEPRYYLSARRIRDTEEVGTGECSSAGIATPQEFPYQQTFDAIAAATELWPCKEAASGISISVRKFQEAFNSHRDAKPPVGVAQSAPEPGK